MFLSNLAVNRSVLTTMMVMVLVVLGLFSYTRLSVDLFPETNYPIITVTTLYPGAGPKEIESQVTEKIEEEVIAISNVRRVESTSSEGVSFVLIEFELDVDADLAAIDVKDKVESIQHSLPTDAEPSSIRKFDIGARPIMDIAISGELPLEEVYRIADTTVKDSLSRVNGVSSVSVVGGKEREIQVLVHKDRLSGYGLSITDVVRAISMANLSTPAGRITQDRKEFNLRLLGELRTINELARLEVTLPSGEPIRLTELAEVRDGFKEQRELARYNGNPTVSLSIQKRADANVVETAMEVDKAIERLRRQLKEHVRIDVVQDTSIFIREAVRDVQTNLMLGIFLTGLVLYIFLHNFRATFIVALAMPTSIIATFLLIDFAGFTLNLMSLMALGISVGILVANVIVVLENISRHMERGESPRNAAKTGTAEVTIAVIASTMTNVMVFTPIGFMSGFVGQVFKQFGLTVVFATLFSLFVSLTLTPMLASRLLKSGVQANRQSGNRTVRCLSRFPILQFVGGFAHLPQFLFRGWDWAYAALERRYRIGLAWTLRHRISTSIATAHIFIGSLMLFRFIGVEFISTLDGGVIVADVEMPPGTSLDATDAQLLRIEGLIAKSPEVEAILTTLGGSGQNQGVQYGKLVISLQEERERETLDVLNEIRDKLQYEIPDAQFGFTISSGDSNSQADIIVEVTGLEMKGLETVAEQVETLVADVPGLVDVTSALKTGKPELAVALNRRKLERYGLSMAQVGTLLRTSLTGEVASRYRQGDEEYDIRVQLAEDARQVVEDADRILINVGGEAVPLAELGDVYLSEGPTQIVRQNKQRMVTVTANIGEGALGKKLNAITTKTAALDLPVGYAVNFGGDVEMMNESFVSLFTALILAIILTYMLLAAILDSFVHPFTIMITLPLGLVGTSVALFITGTTLNIFSMMAIIMLVGIVVNDAILILVHANRLRRHGMELMDALLEAGCNRLRPIIMTNIAITAGMLPQALGTGGAAAIRASMAIVTIGAVILSAVFTVFVIPVVYTFVDRFAKKPELVVNAEIGADELPAMSAD